MGPMPEIPGGGRLGEAARAAGPIPAGCRPGGARCWMMHVGSVVVI